MRRMKFMQAPYLGFQTYLSHASNIDGDVHIETSNYIFLTLTKYEFLLMKRIAKRRMHCNQKNIIRNEALIDLRKRGLIRKYFYEYKIDHNEEQWCYGSIKVLDFDPLNQDDLEAYLQHEGRIPYFTIECRECGKTYKPSSPQFLTSQIFCNEDCWIKHHKGRKVCCSYCGTKFRMILTHNAITKKINGQSFYAGDAFAPEMFCHRECRRLYNRWQHEMNQRYHEAVVRGAVKLKVATRPKRGQGYNIKIRAMSEIIQEKINGPSK